MSFSPEQFAATNEANVAAALSLASSAFANAERLTARWEELEVKRSSAT